MVGLLFGVFTLLALFVVGAVVIAISPRATEATADRLITAPWMSLLIGFILLVAVPAAVGLIAITLIGIPLSLILLFMYVIMIYFSRAFAALAIGRWLFARFGKPGMSLYVDLLVGLLILWLLIAIPYVGWLIHLIAVLLGIGAAAAQRYALLRDLRREGRV